MTTQARARTKGRFPDARPSSSMLLIARMLSLRRATAMVQAISGLTLCEATCLSCLRRLHEALASWERSDAHNLHERLVPSRAS